MKKFAKKLTLAIVLVLACVLSLVTIVACNENGEHEHAYISWGHDEQSHWRVCPVDNEKEEGSEGMHVDADGDGICDVCGYDLMHVHSYDSHDYDENGHWNVCSCGAKQEGSDADHVNSSDDCACDVCGYEGFHQYVWAFNNDSHWNFCCVCGNDDEDSKVPHVDEDLDGKCDVCEEYYQVVVIVKDNKGNCIQNVGIEINNVEAFTDENGVARLKMKAPDDKLIYVDYPDNYVKDVTYYTADGRYVYNIALISEITNTFVVEDSSSDEPFANVTLKLMDGENVVASGVTDEDGKVTLTYPAGKEGRYKFAVEGLSEDQYVSGSVNKNNIPDEGATTSVNVYTRQYNTYTITVACDEGVEYALEGITVEIWKQGYGAPLIASGKTNASGIATIKAEKSSNSYIAKISGLNEGYKVEEVEVGYDWWAGTTITEATLTIKAADEEGDSNSLSIGSNTVTGTYLGNAYTLTATSAGSYTISSTDSEYCIYDAIKDELIFNAYTINLAADESATILFSCAMSEDSATYNIVVTYNAPGGDQGGEEGDPNTWYTSSGDKIVISDDGITYNGEDVSELEATDSDDSIVYTFYYGAYGYSLYQSGNDWYLSHTNQLGETIVEKLSKTKPSLLTSIPEVFKGTWTGSHDYGGWIGKVDYKFIISADVVDFDGTQCSVEYGSLVIKSNTELTLPDIGSLIYNSNGTITYNDGENEITLTKQASSEGGSTTPSAIPLEAGTHTVSASSDGIQYSFTAQNAGTYTIACADENSLIYIVEGGTGGIHGGGRVNVTLEAGKSVIFGCAPYNDVDECSYSITISEAQSGESGDGEEAGPIAIELGTSVNVSLEAQATAYYTFTPENAGTYTVTCSSDTNNGFVSISYAEGYELISGAGSKNITVAENAVVSISCATQNDQADAYTIIITVATSSGEGDGEGEGSGSGSEGDEEPAEAIFPEGLRGKWSYSIDEIIVEIFAGAIKMDGAEGNIEDSVTSDNITYYNFSVNGNTRYGIYQDGEDWYMGQYGQGILRDVEKLIAVTSAGGNDENDEGDNDESVAISSEIIGIWEGSYDFGGTWGEYSYSFEITADSVIVDGYSCTVENGGLEIVSATSLYLPDVGTFTYDSETKKITMHSYEDDVDVILSKVNS